MTATKTAVAEKVTLDELQNRLAAIEQGISRLEVEKAGRTEDIAHGMAGAVAAREQVDARLIEALHDWHAVVDAIKERRAEEAAEQAAARPQLEADRDAAEKVLAERKVATETALGVLVGAAQAMIQAGDSAYNATIALGYNGGSQMATRERLEARISHVLNVEAGLRGFDVSLSPSGRSPLGEAAAPYKSNMTERPPLPNRRELHDVSEGYPGQNPMSRPVIKTELQKADGTWVDVPIGSYDWPDSVEP